MQATGINILSIVGAAPPSAEAAVTLTSGDGSAPGQQFSQLLGDTESLTSEVIAPLVLRDGTTDLLAGISATTLSAQEITPQPLPAVGNIGQILAKPVTAEIAADLVRAVDRLIAQSGNGSTDAKQFQKFKDQLTQIQTTGVAKPVAELLATVDATAVDTTDAAAYPAAGVGVAQRLLRLIQNTLAKKALDESVEVAPNPAAVNPPVPSFRPAAAADIADADGTAGDAQEAYDYVEITPLAAEIIALPTWAQELNNAASKPLPVTLPPVAVDSEGLASGSLRNVGAPLPPVDLPEVAAAPLAGTEAKPPISTTFIQHLNAAATVAGVTQAAAKPSPEPLPEALVNEKVGATSLVNPSLGSGHVATQTANAVQPLSVLDRPHFVNHAPVSEQVHVAIAQANQDGLDRITISLTPDDLGRVEVKLHVARDGQTQILFTVDRPETFDALSRDARSLERSLQEAGIKADAGSMQFNLRQQPQPQLHSGLGGDGSFRPPVPKEDEAELAKAAAIGAVGVKNYTIAIRDGIDIHA